MSAFVNTVKELEQSFAKVINFVENLFYSYIPDEVFFLSPGKIFPFHRYTQIHDRHPETYHRPCDGSQICS